MIEFIALILALFAWMAASLWLATVFRMPIQVDRYGGSRSRGHTFDFKRGDNSSAITWELEDPETDLEGSTVRFSMKRLDGSTVIERATAQIVHGTTSPSLVYNLATGDADEPGVYEAEFEITSEDQSVEIHPISQSILVKVLPDPIRGEIFVNQVFNKPF